MNDNQIASPTVSVSDVAALVPSDEKARILANYDMKSFAKIFEDGEICETCLTFFKCGLNVSRTAREMFMHRNTLNYRLSKVRDLTGLDVREFDAAVTFEFLRVAYNEIRNAAR